jgi:hypothetical protein
MILKGVKMSYKALFIGINKHIDAAIPELTGTKRDAVALHALFLDSMPDIEAEFCVDDEATYDKLSSEILKTLSDAEKEDVVIITFAGHGSRQGTLVCFDTKASDVSNTTIFSRRAVQALGKYWIWMILKSNRVYPAFLWSSSNRPSSLRL